MEKTQEEDYIAWKMLPLGFHLVHFVKPMELNKGILLVVWNHGSEIIRRNENKNNLSFNLIFHARKIGKIHLIACQTLPHAMIMTD